MLLLTIASLLKMDNRLVKPFVVVHLAMDRAVVSVAKSDHRPWEARHRPPFLSFFLFSSQFALSNWFCFVGLPLMSG